MPKMSEQTRQSVSRISMVFYQKNAQRLCRFSRSLGSHVALFRAVRYGVKHEFEGAAITSATALYFDRSAVQIDKMLRNRQTQAKPAKLTADGRITLFE